jgi:hypothetical protein
MKMKIKIFLTLALVFGSALSLSAQPSFPAEVDDVVAPLPGLALVAFAAIFIGVRKSLKAK